MRKVFIVLDILLIIAAFDIFLINKDNKDDIQEKEAVVIPDSPTLLSSVNSGFYIDTNAHRYSDSEIEEMIINKDKDKVYKLIETKIDDIVTHVLVVYDPANVRLMLCKAYKTPDNSGKENIVDMTARYGAVAGINGGGYVDLGKVTYDIPVGYVIKDGKIIWDNNGQKGNLIGFNYDNELKLITATGTEALAQGIRDAVEFGPYLIINNEVTSQAIKMGDKRASRVVIAQRADGIVLLLVTDGGSLIGPRMSEIVSVLKQYGAVNAANLDGGASSQMVVNGQLLSVARFIKGNIAVGGRRVVNGWGVFDNN